MVFSGFSLSLCVCVCVWADRYLGTIEYDVMIIPGEDDALTRHPQLGSDKLK